MKYIASVIHGHSGSGKSRLVDTAPGPRLILDAEGGSDWTSSPKVKWDPTQPLPTQHEDGSPITTNTTVVVLVRNFEQTRLVLNWLQSGQHYFESVVWDSITEIQKRCKDAIRGLDADMTERLWGTLLEKMERLVRDYRDLRHNPIKRVNVFITALTIDKNNRQIPDVQGALSRQLTSYVDVTGHLFAQATEGDPGARHLAIQPVIIPPSASQVDAKDRTDILTQRYGAMIQSPNLTALMAVLNEGAA